MCTRVSGNHPDSSAESEIVAVLDLIIGIKRSVRFEERGVQAKQEEAANMSGFDVWSSSTLYSTLPNRQWFSTVGLARAAFQLQVCSRKRSKTKILLV